MSFEERPRPASEVSQRVRLASPAGQDLVARIARAGIESRLFGDVAPVVRVGRYEVIAELGTGGMGVVYRARDPELDRDVALKLVRATAGGSRHDPETARARLVREARAMAKLTHPNVATVHEVGTFEDQIFVAMELVEGLTLAQWSATRERSLDEVLTVFMAAGRGLQAAHAKGIVHRDFKPENVMVAEDGRVLVLDFGLARDAGSPAEASVSAPLPASERPRRTSVDLTRAGSLVGTPAYMSPELYAGEAADARSDQFAYCVALWEAAYRQRPFAGDNVAALAHAVLAGDIISPIGMSGRPAWIRRVLERGLAVDPEHRYASMGELLDALEDGQRPRTAQRWWPAAVGGLTFVVGVVVASTRPPADVAVPAPSVVTQPDRERRGATEPDPAAANTPATSERGATAVDAPAALAALPAPSSMSAAPGLVVPTPAESPTSSGKRKPRSWPRRWCYLGEDSRVTVRSATKNLLATFDNEGKCHRCSAVPEGNTETMRHQADDPECQRYAVCHETACEPATP